jgi:hypothetical protein
MGFFSNLGKSLNPFQNPVKGVKNALSMGIDPAGSVVRAGKTGDMSPHNVKGMYDPGGFIGGVPQAAPNSYTPQHVMNLSPAAQQMYDAMQARTAARNAGVPYNPTPSAPVVAPQLPHRTPLGQQPAPTQTPYDPGLPPQQLADGGMVGQEFDGDYWENKSFERKPNGKPY